MLSFAPFLLTVVVTKHSARTAKEEKQNSIAKQLQMVKPALFSPCVVLSAKLLFTGDLVVFLSNLVIL